jgi:hypothetical protein
MFDFDRRHSSADHTTREAAQRPQSTRAMRRSSDYSASGKGGAPQDDIGPETVIINHPYHDNDHVIVDKPRHSYVSTIWLTFSPRYLHFRQMQRSSEVVTRLRCLNI